MEKTVVIGSNSFSGASFTSYLIEHGINVLGISRSAEPAKAYRPYSWGPAKGDFIFKQLDLNHHTSEIAEAIAEFKPDYVVNFSALGMVAESWLYPGDYYRTNVLGNVLLHDELRKMDFIKRYVHISTPEVYGNTNGLVKEDHPYSPSTPYAASRAACDIHLKTFYEQYKFPWTFTRAANVYGPGQQPFRIVPRTILSVLLGEKLQLHGGGKSVRSFIHMRDVSAATLKIAREGTIGEGYHLSTDRFVSIKELVEMICNIMNVDPESIIEIASDRAGKDQAYLLDSSKAREQFGWEEMISLEAGLAETIEWVKSYLDDFKAMDLSYKHKA